MSEVEKSCTDEQKHVVNMMVGAGHYLKLPEEMRLRVVGLMAALAWCGYGRLRVTHSLRSLDEQQRLFGKGRSEAECRKAGVNPAYADPSRRKVTWCQPEAGAHVQGRAVDVAVGAYREEEWQKIGRIAKLLGWTWGGDWSVRDYCHFEWNEGR